MTVDRQSLLDSTIVNDDLMRLIIQKNTPINRGGE